MIPEPGRRFGPYEIQGRLGGGGMGHVFRAWDARLHREVAIKLLHNEYAMPGMRERFLREARAASALNHPHICSVFDIGEQDGDPYLVMELLEGISLKDRIVDTSMSFEEIVCVSREIAEALGAAHAKGVIHRDIKPANIFLVRKPNGSFQSKVLDFGLAKIEGGVLGARGGRTVDITTAGATVGTLAYMSPEQARGEVLDSRSDLFSLGVVMYEMATRHIPFPGATSALVFVKLLNQPPEPVREWNDAIPRDLEKVIFKLIAKERTARYQTAAELEQALKQIEEKGQGGAASWLRKAVSTAPMGRSADVGIKERRGGKTSSREHEFEAAGERAGAAASPANQGYPAASALIRPAPPHPANAVAGAGTPAESQFIRPVARIPRGEAMRSTGQSADAGGALAEPAPAQPAREQAAGRSAVGLESGPLTPAPAQNASARTANAAAAPPGLSSAASARANSAVLGQVSAQQSGAREAIAASASPPVQESSRQAAAVPVQPAPERGRRGFAWLTPQLLAGLLILLIVAAIATALIVHHGRFGPTMLTEDDPVAMTEIDNRTGEKTLDGSVAAALSLALSQSPYLLLRGEQDYLLARHQVLATNAGERIDSERNGEVLARAAARRLHAKAYFYGTVSGSMPPYQLHVDLLDTESNDMMTSVDEQAPSLQQLPAAIDRAAGELRGNAGEDADSIGRSEVSLADDATASLDALHEFALGEDAFAAGRTMESLVAWQAAAEADPQFAGAQLRLASTYRKLHAEIAAAEAAKLGLAASDHASERVRALAQFEYEMDASGDYGRAVAMMRKLLSDFPRDAEALTALSRVLRLEGHMSEALQVAQQAYAADPLLADAYTQAEDAMIGLDHYDAAYQLNLQAQRLGLAKGGTTLAAAYLEGRESAVTEALSSIEGRSGGAPQNLRADFYYGIYLDNAGKLARGSTVWRMDANSAVDRGLGLKSAASFMLAQGALDRGLLGECGDALDLAHEAGKLPSGLHSTSNQGMAEALCGDRSGAQAALSALRTNYPQSFAVTSFYLADIQSALDMAANDPAAALEVLRPATQYDLISLTAFLRGRAHVALGQAQIGIVDYQTVLAHRGATFVIGSDVYPAAEIGVARAFAGIGDTSNSSQAYRRFLDLWNDADPGQPLLIEAQKHAP